MYNFIMKYPVQSGAYFSNECYPKYSEDLIFEDIKNDNRIYSRTLKTELKFIGVDLLRILQLPFGIKMTVEIYKDSVLFFVGYFYTKQEKANLNENNVIVNLETDDNYKKILDIKDTNYRLVDLPLAKKVFSYSKFPLIQFYVTDFIQGDYEVTNYLNGNTWKQNCNSYTANEIFYESNANPNQEPTSTDWSYVASAKSFCKLLGNYDVSGDYYSSIISPNGIVTQYKKYDNSQRIDLVFISPHSRWEIINNSTNITTWISSNVDDENIIADIKDYTFTNVFNSSLHVNFSDSKWVFVRVLYGSNYNNTDEMFDTFLSSQKIQNTQTFCKNEQYYGIVEDFTINNTVNKYYEIVSNSIVTTTPTIYNVDPNGKYFTQQISDNNYKYFPIGMGSWSYFSIWLRGTKRMNDYQFNNKVEMRSKAGYFIKDIVKAILLKNNISINYYSEFFDSANNPISNDLRKYPLITDITNLTGKNPYSNSQATRTEINLQQIMTFLADSMNVYWDIKKVGLNYQLRFEHMYFYDNGERYIGTPNFIDLTTKENTRNTESWAYGIDEYTYDVPNEDKYHEFETMESSDYFNKSLMTIQNENNSTKNIDLQLFNMDIDYITTMSGDTAQSGFFFAMCDFNANIQIPINRDIFIKQNTYNIQNYYASIPYLTKSFNRFNLSKTSVTIDGITYATLGFYRVKIQQVTIPNASSLNLDLNKLIKTNLGIAFIRKSSLYLENDYLKIEIAHTV